MLKKFKRSLLAFSLAGFLINGTQVFANEVPS